jgi:hypothetical protein
MANSIDWGQGATNNNIGWGQGASNNNIGWGSVYSQSYNGETEIIGIDPEQTTINAFKVRVAADGGVFEAESCMLNTLNNIG